MTTADDKGKFVERGPDRREGEERRKTPRLSFDEDRRQGQRRTDEDRRKV